jgi:hypothetical protein
MTTINDVLRHLVRGGPNSEANIQRMLLTIDSHEKGYETLEDYEAELAKQAANRPLEPGQVETPEQRANRLEADNERLQALLRAGQGVKSARPESPA